MRPFLLLALLLTTAAQAQSCPKENPNGPPTESAPLTLTGKLIYHNEIRDWFELRLAKPVCGQASIQLLAAASYIDDRTAYDATEQTLETLRGCHITTHGWLQIPLTGYYSAALYQGVSTIEEQPGCVHQSPLPDYSKLKPAPSIRTYRVDMQIDYGPQGGPVTATIRSGNRTLTPWQVYASYDLTGGFVFYGHCADGFAVTTVSGTPQGNPSHFDEPGSPDDMAAFDPESAAAKHIFHQRLSYTCRRLK